MLNELSIPYLDKKEGEKKRLSEAKKAEIAENLKIVWKKKSELENIILHSSGVIAQADQEKKDGIISSSDPVFHQQIRGLGGTKAGATRGKGSYAENSNNYQDVLKNYSGKKVDGDIPKFFLFLFTAMDWLKHHKLEILLWLTCGAILVVGFLMAAKR